MVLIHDFFQALWQQDFHLLIEQNLTWAIYLILFIVVFLENGLLPTAFLPGDSLLFLTGALIANGTLYFNIVFPVLIIAAALGYWVCFLQGRWVGHVSIVQRWLAQVPERYHRKAENLFIKHGLSALIIARFLAYVRTMMPLLAGLSRLDAKKFQLFNWLSATIWVIVVVLLGYSLAHIPLIKQYQKQTIELLMLIPILLLVVSLGGIVFLCIKKWFINKYR